MRTHRAAILLVVGSALAVASLTLLAQAPPAGGVGNLSAAVANLQARVQALEALPPGAGALRVLDATDKFIGFWDVGDGIENENPNTMSLVNGLWLGVSVDTDGFKSRRHSTSAFFVSNDCSGPIYLRSDWSIAREGFVLGQTLYYPGDPVTDVLIGSAANLNSDGSITDCFTFPAGDIRRVGPIAQVDVASLGTPPFRIAAQ